MGAILKLIFGGDKYNAQKSCLDDDEWITPEPATLEVGMTEADFSNKRLGAAGAIIISAWISHKDNGAMTSLNLAGNSIGGHTDGRGRFIGYPQGTMTSFCYTTRFLYP
jgi:hypothetical protein